MILSESAHCAIVLVAELIRNHEIEGVTCSQISERHHVPQTLVEQAACVLESLSIVSFKPINDGEPVLCLTKDPERLKLEEVIVPFDQSAFGGLFIDEASGAVLPQSPVGKYINKEREYINAYLKKRYRGISLKKWVEQAEKNKNTLLAYGV